jgi:two-component system NarL family sensor kinase
MNLSAVKSKSGMLDPKSAQALCRAIALSTQPAEELRIISYLLFPPELTHDGIASAVPAYVEGFAQRSEMKVELKMPPDLDRLGEEIGTAVFRILQESLTNIHRHSGSETAQVQITLNDGEIVLDVSSP